MANFGLLTDQEQVQETVTQMPMLAARALHELARLKVRLLTGTLLSLLTMLDVDVFQPPHEPFWLTELDLTVQV